MTKVEHQDIRRELHKPIAWWYEAFSREQPCHGTITTLHGIVECYAQGNGIVPSLTILHFAREGVATMRSYPIRHSRFRMAQLAVKFVNEIVEENM